MFELEDSRRQFNGAQESAIAAARDRAQAWVALVRAAGGQVSLQASAVTGSDTIPSQTDHGGAQRRCPIYLPSQRVQIRISAWRAVVSQYVYTQGVAGSLKKK